MDTGNLEYPGNSIQVQPPSIWIFDLNTDFLVRRAEIPTANVIDGHGIASITVDIDENNCGDAFAYLPDLVNYRMHVYRWVNRNIIFQKKTTVNSFLFVSLENNHKQIQQNKKKHFTGEFGK